MAVARKEGPQAQRVAGMARPDEHGVANGIGDQISAAQHERAQKELAESGVGLHDPAQTASAEFEHRASLADPATDQAAPAGKLVHFTGERSRPKNADHVRLAV